MSVPVAIPLAQVYPEFSKVQAAELPKSLGSCAITPELWGIIQHSETLSVRQHVKLAPKHCCSCPPCVQQENTYSIYSGLSRDNQFEILRADEVSDDWNRCCCKPYHPLRLEVRQYIPVPGDATKSDWSHLTDDVRNDFNRFMGQDREIALKNMYKQQPPLMSMVRHGGLRCCWKCPCKLLSCCVCCSVCQDGMTAYPGSIADEIKENGTPKEVGRPWNLDPTKSIASAIQPIFAGWCMPTVHLRTEGQTEENEPFGKVQGPFCFGGWSEMCCNFRFPISGYHSSPRKGDLGDFTKLRPSNLGMAVTELMSDSDMYSLHFKPEANLNASQKVAALTSLLLADYMYFDGQTDKCAFDGNSVTCYLWYCSCIGCIVPCKIVIPLSNNN